jgi:pilus assembly protein CpaB
LRRAQDVVAGDCRVRHREARAITAPAAVPQRVDGQALVDRDILLSAEADDEFGTELDGEWADTIPLVGFLNSEGADAASLTTAPAARQVPGALERLIAEVREAGGGTRPLYARAIAAIRYWLFGSLLRAQRTRVVLVVMLAVMVSAGVGLGLRSLLRPLRVEPRRVETPEIVLSETGRSVLVARQSIPRGHILQPKELAWRPWPSDGVQASFITLDTHGNRDFSGYVATQSIAPGEMLTQSKIAAPGKRSFLSVLLRPGMRAVSVLIGPETAASGLIMPGNDVDVMFTLPLPALDPNGRVSLYERAAVQTVLCNIHVLAIDEMMDGELGRAIVGHTATLEVTPKEAEILALANEIAFRGGMLTLTLRSLVPGGGDETQASGEAATRPFTLDTDVSRLLSDRPIAVSGAAVRTRSVTIVRRNRVTQMKLAQLRR